MAFKCEDSKINIVLKFYTPPNIHFIVSMQTSTMKVKQAARVKTQEHPGYTSAK